MYFIGEVLIFIGCLFVLTSLTGFVKFRDPFRMMHVSGICDLIGAPLIIIGCGVIFLSKGDVDAFLKTIFLSVIFYIVSPVTTNAISESACRLYGEGFIDNYNELKNK